MSGKLDVTRISEDYFRALLAETDATTAVCSLNCEWLPRASVELPRWGLAPPEYYASLCIRYTGQVSNGGHSQFFFNCGGGFQVREVLSSLAEISATRAHDILLRAYRGFPCTMPDGEAETQALFKSIPEESLGYLDELDRELWEDPTDEILLEYLRQNADRILRPERGLPAGE
jgi:hypothetical protein